MEDLFKTPEKLPAEVQEVLKKYEDWPGTYQACNDLLKELKPLGYEFDYYLDAEPYNLRKIK